MAEGAKKSVGYRAGCWVGRKPGLMGFTCFREWMYYSTIFPSLFLPPNKPNNKTRGPYDSGLGLNMRSWLIPAAVKQFVKEPYYIFKYSLREFVSNSIKILCCIIKIFHRETIFYVKYYIFMSNKDLYLYLLFIRELKPRINTKDEYRSMELKIKL